MVTKTEVNAERVYYNYHGQMPPVTLEPEPATLPPDDGRTEADSQTPHSATAHRTRGSRSSRTRPACDTSTCCTSWTTEPARSTRSRRSSTTSATSGCWTSCLERGYEYPQDHDLDPGEPEGRQGALRDRARAASRRPGCWRRPPITTSSTSSATRRKEEAIEKYLKPILTALRVRHHAARPPRRHDARRHLRLGDPVHAHASSTRRTGARSSASATRSAGGCRTRTPRMP